jgi:hypothetical protein
VGFARLSDVHVRVRFAARSPDARQQRICGSPRASLFRLMPLLKGVIRNPRSFELGLLRSGSLQNVLHDLR